MTDDLTEQKDSDLSPHELRMQNGFMTAVVLALFGGLVYVVHVTLGWWPVLRVVGLGVAACIGLYAVIWFLGVLTTDIPPRVKGWLK